MLSIFQRVSAQAQGESGYRKNALQAVVWACGVFSVPVIGTVFYRNTVDLLAVIALLIAAIPPLMLAIGFYYFMKNDPNRLHSEGFQLKRQALELIEEKGKDFAIDATSIQRISDPNGSPPSLKQSNNG